MVKYRHSGVVHIHDLVTSERPESDGIKVLGVLLQESLWLELLRLGEEVFVVVAGCYWSPHLHVFLDEQSWSNL